VLRNIQEGEVLTYEKDFGENCTLIAHCKIFDKDITFDGCTLETRKGFPFHKSQIRGKCGFKFVQEST